MRFLSNLVLTTVFLFTSFNLSAITPAAPSLSAKSWILMDFHSGQVIASVNPDQTLPPASLTKMMTGYVVSHEIEAGNLSLSEKTTVSENAWAKNFPDSSKMFIEVNKQVSIEDLLRGVIIQSGNDASVALAEHLAGSEDAFAEVMNVHARRLGMTNTHFMNATGLHHDDHFTTARDMAILGQALIRDFPKEYAIYAEKEFTYNNIRQSNRNSLLWDRSLEVDGIKTGHTEAAGYCLVTSAEKDGMRLVAVVMGTDSETTRKVESKKLLTYGFRFFETVKPVQANTALHTDRIWYGESETLEMGIGRDVYVTIPRNRAKDLQANFVLDNELSAPIQRGTRVGKLFFQLDGEDIAEVPLVALQDVAEAGIFGRAADSVARWWNGIIN